MEVLRSLHALPSFGVYAVFMLGAAGLAMLACFLPGRGGEKAVAKDQLDLAMRTSGAVTAALTLTLAFCAVQARNQFADAQRLVGAEVSAIGGLARIAARLGPPGEPLRGRLAEYVDGILHHELPRMAGHGRDAETQRRAEAVEHAVYRLAAELPGAMGTDLLEEEDAVAAARERRLENADGGLPEPFWLLILLLLGLLTATGPLYPRRAQVAAMLGIQAAGVGALVAFVFMMDQPFRGRLAVSPAPYAALLQGLAHRAEVSPVRYRP